MRRFKLARKVQAWVPSDDSRERRVFFEKARCAWSVVVVRYPERAALAEELARSAVLQSAHSVEEDQRRVLWAATGLLDAIQEDKALYAWFSGSRALVAASQGRVQLERNADSLHRGTFVDGRASTVLVLPDGGLLEVRRGDLTGKALQHAGQRIFANWDAWLTALTAE